MVVASFAGAILVGYLMSVFPKKLLKNIAFFLIAIVIGINSSYFKPKDWFMISDIEKLSGDSYQRQITASIYDYLPKSAKKAPDKASTGELIISKGEVVVSKSERESNSFYYDIKVLDEVAEVIIPTYDFPGWKVYVDEKESGYETTGKLGLLKVKVNKGKHILRANLTKSFPRKAGDAISTGGILTAAVLLGKSKKKT